MTFRNVLRSPRQECGRVLEEDLIALHGPSEKGRYVVQTRSS